ncbi:hypothetical protein KOR42_23510 [Thalassoglobus neptunius]|uniref:Uncharacterized protein n=1 Tax=Thalassoglobus neptunius TaxID=1938619 RepID=A0A5C5X7S6_9PLAN|nr:hypothetical protein [Thalassoglobus neptunius]TWT58964.1 hypothetical protein KOR42_23510 [Thalassoglobus neptunius]
MTWTPEIGEEMESLISETELTGLTQVYELRTPEAMGGGLISRRSFMNEEIAINYFIEHYPNECRGVFEVRCVENW